MKASQRVVKSTVGWLGSLRDSHWILVWGGVCACSFWCLLGVLVLPAVDPMLHSSERRLRIHELEQRKLSMQRILERLSSERDAESQFAVVPATASVDTILELIQKGAQASKVRVSSLTNESSQIASGDYRVNAPYRFSVHGPFPALRQFVATVSQTTSGLLLSELVIHNPSWPDFSGSLEAQITLRVVRGP
jgi:hypothetical protein